VCCGEGATIKAGRHLHARLDHNGLGCRDGLSGTPRLHDGRAGLRLLHRWWGCSTLLNTHHRAGLVTWPSETLPEAQEDPSTLKVSASDPRTSIACIGLKREGSCRVRSPLASSKKRPPLLLPGTLSLRSKRLLSLRGHPPARAQPRHKPRPRSISQALLPRLLPLGAEGGRAGKWVTRHARRVHEPLPGQHRPGSC
jgi:hypothetical protein